MHYLELGIPKSGDMMLRRLEIPESRYAIAEEIYVWLVMTCMPQGLACSWLKELLPAGFVAVSPQGLQHLLSTPLQ